MIGLKRPVGNCIDCNHFAVCKLAEQWKNQKQEENNNCGMYQNLSTFDIINSFTLASRNIELEKENKVLLSLVNTNVVLAGRKNIQIRLIAKKIRHEAMKEFAEGLKKKCGYIAWDGISPAMVDNLLKEKTEGKK